MPALPCVSLGLLRQGFAADQTAHHLVMERAHSPEGTLALNMCHVYRPNPRINISISGQSETGMSG